MKLTRVPPLGWIRWKVVLTLVVLGVAGWWIGVDGILLGSINSAGQEAQRARWSVSALALGLLAGDLELDEVLVESAAGEADGGATEENANAAAGEQLFAAEVVAVKGSMEELLRGRYVLDEVELRLPKVDIERRADGSTNLGDLGAPEEEPEPAAGEPTDWVEVAKTWYERIQKWREKLPERGETSPPVEEPGRKKSFANYGTRVTYPFAGRPDFLVRTVRADGLEVRFADEAAEQPLPPLEKCNFELREVSSNPALHDQPISLQMAAELAGAPLKLNGTFDLREGAALAFDFQLDGLPVAVVEAFVGKSLPVHMSRGTVSLATGLDLGKDGSLKAAPKLALNGVQLEAKDPGGKIAGFPAQDFVRAFNEASAALDAVNLADLTVGGTLENPEFAWGDTVRNLVVSGGKAFAQKQIDAGVAKGKEVAAREIDKAKEQLEKELENSETGKQVKEELEKAGVKVPTDTDGALDAAGGLLKKGLFGDK